MVCEKQLVLLLALVACAGAISAKDDDGRVRYLAGGMFRDQTYLELDNDTLRFINGHSLLYVPGIEGIVEQITLSPYRVDASSGLPFLVETSSGRRVLLLRNRERAHLIIEALSESGGSVESIRIFSGFESNMYDTLTSVGLYFARAEVSSYLQEGPTAYGVENLRGGGLHEPWVEGAPGHGIGEYIEFDLGSEAEREVGTFNGIYVYNGFIDYDRPHLYHQNSRVRRFLVRDLTANEEWTVELEDTPHPQIIEMEGRERHRIQLVIDAVYPGTRYEDTCIAAIALRGYYPE